VDIAWSASQTDQITVDILDTVTPTPNWYGKGIVTVNSGTGSMTLQVEVYDQLTKGTQYILRAWTVQEEYVNDDAPWSYQMDVRDYYAVAGDQAIYANNDKDAASSGTKVL
jgi:hypothetical protein